MQQLIDRLQQATAWTPSQKQNFDGDESNQGKKNASCRCIGMPVCENQTENDSQLVPNATESQTAMRLFTYLTSWKAQRDGAVPKNNKNCWRVLWLQDRFVFIKKENEINRSKNDWGTQHKC